MTRAHGQKPAVGLSLVLLFAVCAALAALNWHITIMPIDTSPATSETAAIEATFTEFPGTAGAVTNEGVESFPETLARPLFRMSRRPAPPEEPVRAERPVQPVRRSIADLPEDLELVGIMRQNGKGEKAMIRSGNTPNGQWVEVGYELGEWRLNRIERSRIIFEAGGQSKSLSLFPETGK